MTPMAPSHLLYLTIILTYFFLDRIASISIPINNAGFEADCHLDGRKGHVCWEEPTGWQTYKKTRHCFIGLINPVGDPQFMRGNGATEGNQCIFISVHRRGFGKGEFGIEQRLSTRVIGDTTYTLTVDVGNPESWGDEHHYGWPGARVYLLAGNQYIQTDDILALDDGKWSTRTIAFTVHSKSKFIGQTLAIRLTNLNHKYGDPSLNEILFDNVRLDATKVTRISVGSVLNALRCLVTQNVHLWIRLSLILMPMLVGFLFLNFYGLYVYGYKYDEHVAKNVTSLFERPFYEYLYAYNASPESKVYELNFKYDNVYECRVCLHEFGRNGNDEDILHCGHRFHNKCLREWELQQLKQNYFKSYRCPICRKAYNWKQKWHDAIGEYVRMHERFASQNKGFYQ